jgi:pyruvate/2-oxoglutarate dehydrogenase complex dihydrolipoamide dehydrogenase (E3) component
MRFVCGIVGLCLMRACVPEKAYYISLKAYKDMHGIALQYFVGVRTVLIEAAHGAQRHRQLSCHEYGCSQTPT